MILGMTGGVGSGKSTVSGFLEKEYGFVFIGTDDVAKDMMRNDEALKKELKKAFGESIYRQCGELDKKEYARIIYQNEENLRRSNEIVHPAVWAKVQEMILKKRVEAVLRNEKEPDFLVETALPGETFKEFCDELWFVKTEKEARIARLMTSRGYTREYALSIIENQQPDSFFENLSDVVIENSGTPSETYEQVRKELKRLTGN